MTTLRDIRFETPLYTIGEAASIVGVPAATLATWARGYERRFPSGRVVKGSPIVTDDGRAARAEPTMPFVGLAEAAFLAAIRRTRVPMQRIRPALEVLQRKLGVEHALASERLLTDGAELLWNYAREIRDEDGSYLLDDVVVVRSNQGVFAPVIADYLHTVTWDGGYARALRLTKYRHIDVVVDPEIAFGSPVIAISGTRVSDILERYVGGDSISVVAREFGATPDEVEDLLRVELVAA